MCASAISGIFLPEFFVSFYSCVWLISNDVIVGTAFGAFLCENNIVLARLLNYAVEVSRYSTDRNFGHLYGLLRQSVLVNWVQHALLWLDSWPAGLKLNTELSRFYSYTFIDVIAVWGRVYFNFRFLCVSNPHFS